MSCRRLQVRGYLSVSGLTMYHGVIYVTAIPKKFLLHEIQHRLSWTLSNVLVEWYCRFCIHNSFVCNVLPHFPVVNDEMYWEYMKCINVTYSAPRIIVRTYLRKADDKYKSSYCVHNIWNMLRNFLKVFLVL